jgi:hypothetical protein
VVQTGPFAWSRLRHSLFGGSTLFTALIGTNIPEFSPIKTPLRRNLGHVLDHTVRPRPSQKPDGAGLTMIDRLHPNLQDTEVTFQTSFTATGWGRRQLTLEEVGIAFGFPSWLRLSTSSVADFPVVPLQILDGCLRALPQATTRHSPIVPPLPAPLLASSDRTWLSALQRWLPHTWVDASLVTDKAVKHDNADAPTHLWDARCLSVCPTAEALLPLLRKWLHVWASRRMLREFRTFLRCKHGPEWSRQLTKTRRLQAQGPLDRGSKRQRGGEEEENLDIELERDASVGIDAFQRFQKADWWNWSHGSALIFWRWPEGEQQKYARDGMEVYIKKPLPRYHRPAQKPKAEQRAKILEKLKKVLDRGYMKVPVSLAFVKSLIDSFPVEKDEDIRMVYNGTSSGLNDALYAPGFWLPFPASAARVLGVGYFMVDMDLGEMFLNFPLPAVLERYSGVDFGAFRNDLKSHFGDYKGKAWPHWTRCWMGLTPSPYWSVRFFYFADEFARGNRQDPKNALRWDAIKLNLPGDSRFDPTLPWVMKWDSEGQKIAGDMVAFVDDLRASGRTLEEAWSIARQVGARLQYLGIQDAPRKRRPPSQLPGAWAGSVFDTTQDRVIQTVTQKKWDRAKSQIQEILAHYHGKPDATPDVSYKRLEEVRGFLGHLAMTYDLIATYLKGFHLTLSSIHPNRDKEGWKMSKREWISFLWDARDKGNLSADQFGEMFDEAIRTDHPAWTKGDKPVRPPPKEIQVVPRLHLDLKALESLLEAETPAEVLVRASRVFAVLYGFADASGKGFGSTVLGKDGIRYRIGTWDSDTEDESSNFREFENVVCALEAEARTGALDDAIIFMCTDNSTVEAALAKGNSSSRKLYELVLRVRLLEMRHRCKIIVSHVSGERMKAQGTDGVSRGQMKEGVTAGLDMMSFIPFHQSAIQRSPQVRDWIGSWLGPEAEFLEPKDWFERGHDVSGGSYDSKGFWRSTFKPGKLVWAPPPGAANVALEELRKARIKRQHSIHIFVCPRLLKPLWFRQLYKAADVVFDVPPGVCCWPTNMFEPMIIGIVFPFLNRAPWQVRSTPKMLSMERQLRKVWEVSDVAPRNLLRKLLLDHERLQSLPPDVVRRMLFYESRSPLSYEGESHRHGGKRKRSKGETETDLSLGKASPAGQPVQACSRRRPYPRPIRM